MEKQSFLFLKKLMDTPSPSGFEQPIQRLVREELKKFADEVKTDVHGNVIGAKNPDGYPRIMLASHCDEIGFMVKYIDKNGFIYFSAIGGIDPHIVPGQRVKVYAKQGPILGVVGKKPIHVMKKEEREKVVEFSHQWIDIGVSSKKEAEKIVEIGDPIVFAPGLEKMQGNLVASRSFDDKMGVFIICEVLKALSEQTIEASVFATSTVQEEIGLRGAQTAAYSIDPQIGIAIDVDIATDFPEINKKREGDIRIDKGVVIFRGPNINPKVGEMLIQTAKEEKIPYQLAGASRATPTDANVIQLSRAGVATALVSVPTRYIHTPVEVLSLSDIESTVRLLVCFVTRVKKEISFIPE